MHQTLIVIAGILLGSMVAGVFIAKRRKATRDTAALIHSLSKNAESNLGVALDAGSIEYLVQRPFIGAKIWAMLSSGGGPYGVTGDSPYASHCNELLVRYVKNERFKDRFPCAHAVMQFAVYLCDVTFYRDARCPHPNPRVREEMRQAVASAVNERRLGRFIKDRPGDIPQDWLKRLIAWKDIEQDVADLFDELVEPEDEFWEFMSPPETWQIMVGRGGIALVRNGTVVAHLIRTMN